MRTLLLVSLVAVGCSSMPVAPDAGTGGGGGAASAGGAAGGEAAGGLAGGASGGGATAGGATAGGASAGGSAGGNQAGGAGGGASQAGGSAGGNQAGGAASDIPAGTVLFSEAFDDANFAARGWYDGPGGTITTTNVSPNGGAGAFECSFAMAATGCAGGKPARHRITPSERVYVRMMIRFSPNWVGSGRAYHPHMFHFTTNKDTDFVGPANSRLTLYIEVVGGRPMLALQDSRNVDPACVLRNNDTFVGCNGNFMTYPFTENRSVAACNGLAGDVDGRDCFSTGTNTWYSARSWDTAQPWFTDTPGPRFKGDWHRLEAYFQLNTIQQGRGVPDGRLRLRLDGQTVVTSDRVLFRTNQHPDMQFTQFLMLPYIGDGSPVVQQFQVDQLVVATGEVP
ncbi:MAG: hypothetical protein JNJ54_27400 [Myxococcaceae bacterium]|nr:hypothetical protein [Myxococcaceae bacterium]